MNRTVDIAGGPRPLVPLDSTAYYAMLEADALPFDGRVELIDGMPIEAEASNLPHGEVLFALVGAMGRKIPPGFKGGTDIAFVLSDTLVLAPDIAIVPKGMDGRDAQGEVILLVIEIADTSLAHDLKTKAPHYAIQGVRDYWVVDLLHRKLHVHRDPGPAGYGAVTVRDWDTPVSALLHPDLTLTLAVIIEAA